MPLHFFFIHSSCSFLLLMLQGYNKGWLAISTRDIGWVVADCTGEGLKAAILCKVNQLAANPLSMERLQDSVDLLLLYDYDRTVIYIYINIYTCISILYMF